MTTAFGATDVKAAEQFSWPAFFGPFHMIVLHFPIGFLTLTVMLELRAMLKPERNSRRAVAFALPITTATALVTVALGWMRAGAGEFDEHLLAWHRIAGIGVLFFCLFAWLMHRAFVQAPGSFAFRFGYRGLLLAAFICLSLAGHFGGSLTHGSGFLTLNAPPAMKRLLAGPPAESTTAKPAGGSLYTKFVQPAFAKKCYSCHGSDKQKGKFRLDLREAMLKGGDSGEPVVTPGDLEKSRLLYHVLLPRDHDDAMPPKGKEPLSPEEIVAVGQWILSGAKFE